MEARENSTTRLPPTNLLERKQSCWKRFCNVLGMVSHVVTIAFTGYVIYLAWPLSNLFSWHPVMMSVAFALLMMEAILFFSPESSLIPKVNRKGKVSYHWITMTTAIACALAGLAIIVVNKVRHGKPHFTSWHGTLGLVSVVYVCLQALGGSLQLFPQFASKYAKLADLKLYHATSGLCLFMLVMATLVLALFTSFVRSGTGDGGGWYFLLGCLMWMAVVVTNQVTTEYLPRALKKPSSQY